MSRLSTLPNSLIRGEDRKCTFCGDLIEAGGHWNCLYDDDLGDFNKILVCKSCKDILLHLYIDTCMDNEDLMCNMQFHLNGLNNQVYGKDYHVISQEEVVVDYIKTFTLDEIAEKKANDRKQRRYREYLKLKSEFEV